MRCRIVTETPAGKKLVNLVHTCVAWYAAQGIARYSHCGVTLYGVYGMAEFNADGSGVVTWHACSTMPGERTRFGPDTTVCVN